MDLAVGERCVHLSASKPRPHTGTRQRRLQLGVRKRRGVRIAHGHHAERRSKGWIRDGNTQLVVGEQGAHGGIRQQLAGVLILQQPIERFGLHERLCLAVAQLHVLVAQLLRLVTLGRANGRVSIVIDPRDRPRDPECREYHDRRRADRPHNLCPARHHVLQSARKRRCRGGDMRARGRDPSLPR